MKDYEDEAFDELEKSLQRKVAHGVTDGSKVTIDRDKLKQVLEALQEVYWSSRGAKHDEAIATIKEALAQPEQEYDWKDLYEKEKRSSAMWIAKYEEVAGPAPKAYPVAQPEQEPDCASPGVCVKTGLACFGQPEQRKPLTIEQSNSMVNMQTTDKCTCKHLPLTDTQKRELIKKSELWDMHVHIGWYSAPTKSFVEKAIQLISETEAAHGIKEQS